MRLIATQFVVIVCLCAVSRAQLPREDLVRAELLADVATYKPGEPFHVGVLLKMAPHYHVYWINPGGSGQATSIELKAGAGCKIEALPFPTPSKIDLPGGLTNFGYEDQVVFLFKVTPPKYSSSNSVSLSASVNWLVCNDDECVPGDANPKLSLHTGNGTADNAELLRKWTAQIPSPATCDATVAAPPSELKLEVSWPAAVSSPPTQIQWFPADNDPLTFKDITVTPTQHGARISAVVEILKGQKISRNMIESVLGYTDGDGNRRGLSLSVPIKPSDKGK